MQEKNHLFHIPVMGTGFSVDTPIRVAALGIDSVISIVDDILLEKIRKYYSEKYRLDYESIPRKEPDGRAKRITAYLNTVKVIVDRKMEEIKKQPFFAKNDKAKYFELLPDDHFLKRTYRKLLEMRNSSGIQKLAKELTDKMRPGSIDVNIMVKVDRLNYSSAGELLSEEYSDAKAALRGYANSTLRSAVVLSAGINQGLYNYMSRFRDFYRDVNGEIKKKIIIKVSNFRSALIQGKYLARKGLEVHEFRIESGLNCGGHTFASNGELLPTILREFREKRDQLMKQFQPMILKFYEKMGWEYPESALDHQPLITVQGGIGTNGELRRLIEDFGVDLTGWASPFLLVPEATCVDDTTRELLEEATEKELYLSEVSPLGVPFNNVRRSGSERWTQEQFAKGNPGSSCPKGFLVSNTDYTEKPICLASREFQRRKLAEIINSSGCEEKKEDLIRSVVEKTCLCQHLGNSALIALGIRQKRRAPQAICPGPNIAYFNRSYTLQEMVDHIYGRGECLVPKDRPHMFAKEMVLYVDYLEKLISKCTYTPSEIKTLRTFRENLEKGMEQCLEIARKEPYPNENLESIVTTVAEQRKRLQTMFEAFEDGGRQRMEESVMMEFN